MNLFIKKWILYQCEDFMNYTLNKIDNFGGFFRTKKCFILNLKLVLYKVDFDGLKSQKPFQRFWEAKETFFANF